MLVFGKARKSPIESAELTPSEKRVMKYMADAFDAVRRQMVRDEGKLLDAVLHKSDKQVAGMVDLGPYYKAQEQIRDELLGELLDGGSRVKLPSIQKVRVNFRFDRANPEAAAWADKEAGLLIREITEEQLAAVRDLVSRSQMGEFTPQQVARQLRNVVGLTSTQASWVENNYRETLDANLKAGMSQQRAQQLADESAQRFQKRIHRQRTETIARTEILRSTHEGRLLAWQQGMDEGFISPYAQKTWSTEIDGRQCDICGPLDGTTVLITEEFPNGEPPIHPNCRCDVLLEDKIAEEDLPTWEEIDAFLASPI